MSEFLTEGLTIVMTTPYLDEAERCARVALLHEGRVLAIDRPSALQAALEGRLLEVIADAARPPLEILAALPGVEDVQSFGERAHVRVAEGTQAQGVATVTDALKRTRYRRADRASGASHARRRVHRPDYRRSRPPSARSAPF